MSENIEEKDKTEQITKTNEDSLSKEVSSKCDCVNDGSSYNLKDSTDVVRLKGSRNSDVDAKDNASDAESSNQPKPQVNQDVPIDLHDHNSSLGNHAFCTKAALNTAKYDSCGHNVPDLGDNHVNNGNTFGQCNVAPTAGFDDFGFDEFNFLDGFNFDCEVASADNEASTKTHEAKIDAKDEIPSGMGTPLKPPTKESTSKAPNLDPTSRQSGLNLNTFDSNHACKVCETPDFGFSDFGYPTTAFHTDGCTCGYGWSDGFSEAPPMDDFGYSNVPYEDEWYSQDNPDYGFSEKPEDEFGFTQQDAPVDDWGSWGFSQAPIDDWDSWGFSQAPIDEVDGFNEAPADDFKFSQAPIDEFDGFNKASADDFKFSQAPIDELDVFNDVSADEFKFSQEPIDGFDGFNEASADNFKFSQAPIDEFDGFNEASADDFKFSQAPVDEFDGFNEASADDFKFSQAPIDEFDGFNEASTDDFKFSQAPVDELDGFNEASADDFNFSQAPIDEFDGFNETPVDNFNFSQAPIDEFDGFNEALVDNFDYSQTPIDEFHGFNEAPVDDFEYSQAQVEPDFDNTPVNDFYSEMLNEFDYDSAPLDDHMVYGTGTSNQTDSLEYADNDAPGDVSAFVDSPDNDTTSLGFVPVPEMVSMEEESIDIVAPSSVHHSEVQPESMAYTEPTSYTEFEEETFSRKLSAPAAYPNNIYYGGCREGSPNLEDVGPPLATEIPAIELVRGPPMAGNPYIPPGAKRRRDYYSSQIVPLLAFLVFGAACYLLIPWLSDEIRVVTEGPEKWYNCRRSTMKRICLKDIAMVWMLGCVVHHFAPLV